MLDLVLVHALEDIATQAQPGGVGVIDLHHVAPSFYGQSEASFFIPGDGSYLQRSAFIGVENGSTEKKV